MALDNRFSTELQDIDEAPVSLRTTLHSVLPADAQPRLLIHEPSFSSMGKTRPAMLLAVTETGWAFAEDALSGASGAATACTFDDTLLLEHTRILLYGRFKIDFIADEEPRTAALEFNSVMSPLYLRAADMILKGIDPESSQTQAGQEPAVSLESWPMQFRNAAHECLMPGQHLLAAVQWPAIHGGFNRELSPAAALLATERELVLISEERSDPWDEGHEHSKWGSIVTYFPAVRLARYHIEPHERFTLLGLETHASHGAERLDLLVPRAYESAAEQVAGGTLRAKIDA